MIVLWLFVPCIYRSLGQATAASHLSPSQVVADARASRLYIAAATAAQVLVWDTPPTYTNQQKVDVGTGSEEDDSACYDVPTLVEVWRTAPYLHDGRAACVRDVLTTHNREGRHGQVGELSAAMLDDLVAYVLTR